MIWCIYVWSDPAAKMKRRSICYNGDDKLTSGPYMVPTPAHKIIFTFDIEVPNEWKDTIKIDDDTRKIL